MPCMPGMPLPAGVSFSALGSSYTIASVVVIKEDTLHDKERKLNGGWLLHE